MNPMDQLYQQLILDHARLPQGRGLVEPFDGESFQVNPACGDKLRLRVVLDGVGGNRLEKVGWAGQGCSISIASTSMMTELAQGQDLATVGQLEAAMEQMMHSRGQGISDQVASFLGDAVALEGVSVYPMRVKCALLGWMALKDALSKAQAGDNQPAHIPEGISL